MWCLSINKMAYHCSPCSANLINYHNIVQPLSLNLVLFKLYLKDVHYLFSCQWIRTLMAGLTPVLRRFPSPCVRSGRRVLLLVRSPHHTVSLLLTARSLSCGGSPPSSKNWRCQTDAASWKPAGETVLSIHPVRRATTAVWS